jgi:hypothetical protein
MTEFIASNHSLVSTGSESTFLGLISTSSFLEESGILESPAIYFSILGPDIPSTGQDISRLGIFTNSHPTKVKHFSQFRNFGIASYIFRATWGVKAGIAEILL